MHPCTLVDSGWQEGALFREIPALALANASNRRRISTWHPPGPLFSLGDALPHGGPTLDLTRESPPSMDCTALHCTAEACVLLRVYFTFPDSRSVQSLQRGYECKPLEPILRDAGRTSAQVSAPTGSYCYRRTLYQAPTLAHTVFKRGCVAGELSGSG
jgi:hypothetical protein